MSFTKSQAKRFKSLDQSGDGFFGDVVGVVKKVAKGVGSAIKFTIRGLSKISSFLEDNGVPPSDQVSFLAWLSGQKKYATAAKVLSAAAAGLKQAGRGPADDAFAATLKKEAEMREKLRKLRDMKDKLKKSEPASKKSEPAPKDLKKMVEKEVKKIAPPAFISEPQGPEELPPPVNRPQTRAVNLSANDVIQLAEPNANQAYDTNKEIPQLAQPNASLGSTPLFGRGSGKDRDTGIPRAWGNSSQGNVIAATSSASPEF